MTESAERLQQLRSAKLRALAARQIGGDGSAELSGSIEMSLRSGAGLLVGSTAYFLFDEGRSLGAAMLLADKADAQVSVVFVSDAADAVVVARQAVAMGAAVQVFGLDGADSSPAQPVAPEAEPPTPAEAVLALDVVDAPDLRVVAEHGVAIAELSGLEVARAEIIDGELSLRVGVGRADQELSDLVHGGKASADRIAEAAAEVRKHRRIGGPPHPLQRLAKERWLRARLLQEPWRVGATDLEPVANLEPRPGLRAPAPAAAIGTEEETGDKLLLICTTGVNPELAPQAADLRATRYPNAKMAIVQTKADNHPATTRQLEKLKNTKLQEARAPEETWS